MHPDEEATIRAFIIPARRVRWLESLSSQKRRSRFLDRLNHCWDFDERYATPTSTAIDVPGLLRSRGAGEACYVTSDVPGIDGRSMNLSEAAIQAEISGWGTILTCIPGRLAYYYDEAGTGRRLLLQRGEM